MKTIAVKINKANREFGESSKGLQQAIALYEWCSDELNGEPFTARMAVHKGPSFIRKVGRFERLCDLLIHAGLVKKMPANTIVNGGVRNISYAPTYNDKTYPVGAPRRYSDCGAMGAKALSGEKAITLKRIVSLIGSASHIARQANVGIPTINKIKNNPKPGINYVTKQKIDAYLTGLRDQINEYLNEDPI